MDIDEQGLGLMGVDVISGWGSGVPQVADGRGDRVPGMGTSGTEMVRATRDKRTICNDDKSIIYTSGSIIYFCRIFKCFIVLLINPYEWM